MEELTEKLDRWPGYDVSAGMGRLKLDVEDSGFGEVILEDSFLSDKSALPAAIR